MNWFIKLSLLKKVTVTTLFATIFIFIFCIPCMFFGYQDIAFGVLFGGLGSCASFALFTIKEDKLSPKASMHLSIVFVVCMALIHASTIILAGCLSYLCHIYVFNIFATFISSFIGLMCFIVLVMIDNKKENK